MPSLKRPTTSGISSSLHRRSSVAVSQKRGPLLPDSEDLFCSSPDDDQHNKSNNAGSKKITSKTKETKSNIFKDGSLFSKIINDAGLMLLNGNTANVLSCDQVKFQHSVTKAVLLNQPTDATVTEFLGGLESYLQLPHNLKWSLLYTETSPDCDVASRGNQGSLIRLLLNVDSLQPQLVTLLTETLLTLAYEQGTTDNSLPSLVLGNLQWLDHIVDADHLADAVLLVLQAATPEVQKEIIQFIPNIITDDNHSRTADDLTELYDSTPSLCPAILDALLHLTLSDARVAEVHHTVLRSLQAVEPPHLPCVVKFLLHNTPAASAYQVLCDVREKLHVPPEVEDSRSSSSQHQGGAVTNTENANIAVLVFSTIKMALLLYKHLTNAWLKAIDDAEAVLPVDVLVLAVVHDAVPARRRAVHSILRNKIRAGLQYDTLLHETLSANPAVMREYFDSIKKLAGVMVRSPEPAFSQFGVTLYKTVFECSSGTPTQQQEVVVALLAHLGDDHHVRLTALTLLAGLAHAHTKQMARFSIFLKSSLEQLERLTLQESRSLLDAVTAVAASDVNTALHSDLAIHTRKMLNNSDIRYKRLGVLSAVLTLKNSPGSMDTSTDTTTSSGGSIGGEDVLEVVWACTANCPPASALFMDELASTILRDGINTRLERWLSGKLEEAFESVFMTDLEADTPPLVTKQAAVRLVTAFDLEEDEQAAIALNLGELVDRLEGRRRQEKAAPAGGRGGAPDPHGETILLTLAPHFRLLRMLVSHLNDGELSAIDGLLGCPVYYPHQDTLVPDAFSSLPLEQQTVLLSCLFAAANWFRELINAFVTQKTPELKKKVYSRLRNLLEVERTLSTLLPLCPSYVPHLAASHIDPSTSTPPPVAAAGGGGGGVGGKKKARKPKQNKKSKRNTSGAAAADASTTQASQLPASIAAATLQPADTQHNKQQDDHKRVADLGLYKAYLRELQLDVFCLLFKTMSLDTELQGASNQLSIPEAEFLLTDLNLKLSHVFSAAKRSSVLGKGGKDVGFWHLDLFTAEEVATQAQRFVKPLCVHLDKITALFKSLIADHDGILDCSGVLNERTLPLARVQGRLLTSLHHLLAWPALHRHQQLYTSMLRIICRKQWPDKAAEVLEMGPEQLLWGAFCYARQQLDALLELGSGVLVVRLLEAVVGLAKLLGYDTVPLQEGEQRHSYGHELGAAVATVLCRNWTTAGEGLPDKGALYNQRVCALLQCWMKHSPRPLEVIQQIANEGLDEYVACTNNNPVSDAFPTLNKGTLVIYFSCLMSNLGSSTKKALAAAAVGDTGSRVPEQERNTSSLAVWGAGVEVYSKLFRIVKLHHSRHLLSASLKYSRAFLEMFLSLGMPVMDACLQSHKAEVCKLLKTLQSATRILQIVCTESKVKKDVSLTSYVPLMRRSLASLVFRVKTMLVHHNCSQAFWLGVLKNRSLDGEVIASQSTNEEAARETSPARNDDQVPESDGGNDGDDSDSEEGVQLEDERSDVELDDEESCDTNVSRKRKSIVESDDDNDDGDTDYSTSF